MIQFYHFFPILKDIRIFWYICSGSECFHTFDISGYFDVFDQDRDNLIYMIRIRILFKSYFFLTVVIDLKMGLGTHADARYEWKLNQQQQQQKSSLRRDLSRNTLKLLLPLTVMSFLISLKIINICQIRPEGFQLLYVKTRPD